MWHGPYKASIAAPLLPFITFGEARRLRLFFLVDLEGGFPVNAAAGPVGVLMSWPRPFRDRRIMVSAGFTVCNHDAAPWRGVPPACLDLQIRKAKRVAVAAGTMADHFCSRHPGPASGGRRLMATPGTLSPQS